MWNLGVGWLKSMVDETYTLLYAGSLMASNMMPEIGLLPPDSSYVASVANVLVLSFLTLVGHLRVALRGGCMQGSSSHNAIHV